ncbi:MAG: ribosome biogenesis GTPase YlqF, partial [Tenericutes bacterium HGW-Tenericutes-5]
MKQIQWFPGHMAKARRQIEEKLKVIDIVFELVDARIPISSSNPMLNEIIKDKPKLVMLNKIDLADPKITEAWVDYYRSQGISAIAVNSLND